MRHTSALILFALMVHVYSAPQFITFKDGKLGVNFAGYHAGVGIGGGAGNGAAGGLFAEAGTPHGQAARAGLGGSVNGDGSSAGGLFAGATAGGNVRASAGLGGAAGVERAAGSGYSAASAGGHEAASGTCVKYFSLKPTVGETNVVVLNTHWNKGGESSVSGSSGFKFSGTKSYGIPTAVIKETEISAIPAEHKVHTEFNLDSANEIKHAETDAHINAHHNIEVNAQSDVYKEPLPIVEKTVIHTHYKPSHTHKQTAYIGGYIAGEANAKPVQKRVDIVESSADSGVGFEGSAHAGSGAIGNGQVGYRKEVAFQSNPNFFRDIFNIPISTLQAVSGLLSNTAAGTRIKVEKSGSINAGGNGYGQAGGFIDGSGPYGHSGQIGGEFDDSYGVGHSGVLKTKNTATGGFGFSKYFGGQFGVNSNFNHGY